MAAFTNIYCCIPDYLFLFPVSFVAFPIIKGYIHKYLLMHSWILTAVFSISAFLIIYCCIHIRYCCILHYLLLQSQIFIDTFQIIYCCNWYFLLLHFQLFIATFPYYIAALQIINWLLHFLILIAAFSIIYWNFPNW